MVKNKMFTIMSLVICLGILFGFGSLNVYGQNTIQDDNAISQAGEDIKDSDTKEEPANAKSEKKEEGLRQTSEANEVQEGNEIAVAAIGENNYGTLQNAIDAAEAGDTIFLLQDINESLVIDSKKITVNLNEHTITGDSGSVLYIRMGECTITNGTITGGTGNYNGGTYNGGGVYTSGGVINLNNLIITNNNVSGEGGGVYSNGGTLKISNTTIEGNTAGLRGGAIYAYDPLSVELEKAVIKNNSSPKGGPFYIFIFSDGVQIKMADSEIANNSTSDNTDGTMHLESFFGSDCNITRSSITQNTGGIAGAIYGMGIRLVIDQTEITNNTATSTAEKAAGGIRIDESLVGEDSGIIMTDGMLKDNTTSGSGKANDIYIVKGSKPLNLLSASQMNTPNSDSMVWIDEFNEEEINSNITEAKYDRYLTAVSPEKPEAAVFIDGVNGDDTNDGLTKNSPVRSFAAAKTVLDANSELNTIYVLNKITVAGSEEWSLSNSNDKLLRYPSYRGIIVSVTGTLKLSDITIDGNSGAGPGINDARSIIENAGRIELNAGSVLQNNGVHNNSTWTETWGGAMFNKKDAVAVVSGGTIRNCSAILGGGICSRGELVFENGSIENNAAVNGAERAAGGGIALIYDGKLKMLGGIIKNNTADDAYGGGVSVGVAQEAFLQQTADQSYTNMEMSDGTIENNKAGKSGAGIFIQMNGTAKITGGSIINNELGPHAGIFGGGGIYVNGGKDLQYTDGLLHLSDAVITDNYSESMGAGLANCPTSDLSIYVGNSGAIYGNSSDVNDKDDIWITSKPIGNYTGKPTMRLTGIMLGGGENKWKNVSDNSSYDANELINYTLPSQTDINLYNDPSDKDANKATGAAKVFITGNTSDTSGGGIGSNGDVVIGQAGYGGLKVSKTVYGKNADKEKKFKFIIKLKDESIDGMYGDVEFNEGTGEFHLQDGESIIAYNIPKEIEYEVLEEEVEGYECAALGETRGIIKSETLHYVNFENKYNYKDLGKPDKSDTPEAEAKSRTSHTGDIVLLWPWITAMIVSIIGLLVLKVKCSRKQIK